MLGALLWLGIDPAERAPHDAAEPEAAPPSPALAAS
jgi:hypothetical protein